MFHQQGAVDEAGTEAQVPIFPDDTDIGFDVAHFEASAALFEVHPTVHVVRVASVGHSDHLHHRPVGVSAVVVGRIHEKLVARPVNQLPHATVPC